MIEPVMFFGIGFLVAALLGLLFIPWSIVARCA